MIEMELNEKRKNRMARPGQIPASGVWQFDAHKESTLYVLVVDVSRQNSWVTELFEMYMGMNGKTQSPGNQPDVQTAVFRSESPPRMSRDKLQQGRSVP